MPVATLVHVRILFLVFAVLAPTDRAAAQTSLTAVQERGVGELLAEHRADRAAHFAHDTAAILSELGPELIDVRDGRITRLTRDDVGKRFVEYFASATFSAWDDLDPPIVRVSPDGQMGWIAVRVRIRYTDPKGKARPSDTVEAWTAQYQKVDGRWRLIAVTSTDQP